MFSRKDLIITSNQNRELTQRFQQITKKVTSQLGVSPLVRKKDRIISLEWQESSFAFDTPRFGVTELPRTKMARGGWIVSLATGLQKEPQHILEWVLWREAILSLLLPQIRQITEAADLGLYGGLKYGIKNLKHREQLKKIWQQISPPQYHPYYQYNPQLGFPMFDNVVEGKFLQQVIPWLNTMRTIYQTPIASTTYTAALERWMLETHRPLSTNEIYILKTLTTKPILTQVQLAQHLNMNPSTLSQSLKRLAEENLLRIISVTNAPLIGLNPIGVFFNVSSRNKINTISQWLSQVRYINSIQSFSNELLIANFLIPYPQKDQFKKWIIFLSRKWDLPQPSISLITDYAISRNFDFYEPNVGWLKDFSPIIDQLDRIIEGDMSYPESSRVMKYSYEFTANHQDFPLQLIPEDFIYLQRSTDIVSITERITSRPSKEVQEIGLIGSSHMRYRRRIQKLNQLGISVPIGIGLLHIGLNTVINILTFASPYTTEQLHNTFSLLPYVNSIFFDNNSCFTTLRVPDSAGVEIFSSLRKILAKKDIDLRISIQPAWMSFVLLKSPINPENYDYKNHQWLWSSNDIPKPKT